MLKKFHTWYFEPKEGVSYTSREKLWIYCGSIIVLVSLILMIISSIVNWNNKSSDVIFVPVSSFLLGYIIVYIMREKARNRLIKELNDKINNLR
jgi:uncharacterized membrane protein YhaH (DUF805 family)